MFLKMNTRHQVHKPVNKCNYWGPIFETEWSRLSNYVSLPNSWRFVQPSPRYGNFSIFPRWRPSAILDLLCVCLEHPQRAFVIFITVQNLVGIDAVALIICMFVDFMSLAWKRLLTPQKKFLGDFTPLVGSNVKETPKGTSLCASVSFEPSCAKIRDASDL